MVRSLGEIQLRLVVLCLIYSTTHGISVKTDQPDCKEIQCPQLDELNCPSDSVIRIIQPVFLIEDRANSSLIERNRRDLTNNVAVSTTTWSSIQDTTTSEELPQTITEEAMIETSAITFEDLTDRCCPKSECVCKEICNIPSCQNSSLVLIEITEKSDIPGQCCSEYQCSFEPDCTEVINTKGAWLVDCQICQCLVGQKICHRSCDEIRPQLANCLSPNLRRSFSNGQTWKEDECTQCECLNGEKKCLTSFCKALNCANKIKLSGECCPICAEPVEPETTVIPAILTDATSTTVHSTIAYKPVEPLPPPLSPCDQNERIVHVIQPNNEKCILYGIMAFLVILAGVFIGLYCHVRSKQRSYRPVPIIDKNYNNIKNYASS